MLAFENTYARLPERFFSRQQPTPVKAPTLVGLNEPLARELGLDPQWLRSPAGVAMLAGNTLPDSAEPLAQAYAGHQFGGWVPQLGDGRAILLGEVVDQLGKPRDVQLKGSGRTPYSRNGDGRATLGSVIRESIVSEAMFGLGVPTTRSLAAISSGESIPRQELHPGGILTRIAASHIRVGTFQYFHGQSDIEGVRALADYAIERHYPEATQQANRYLALLEGVAHKQAALIAQWMQLGFIHGVMNTDNMTISGETIDYGPCAFMDTFHPEKVFSSIDRQGRYAWGNQPNIGYWNLERLAETLAPLISEDAAVAKTQIDEALESYIATFRQAYATGFAAKLGMSSTGEKEQELINTTLQLMANQQLDFTLFFRHLTRYAESGNRDDILTHLSNLSPQAFRDWATTWEDNSGGSSEKRTRLMQSHNPILIPRNHQVEQAIIAAERGDLAPYNRLTQALQNPYQENPANQDLETPPTPEEIVQATFCGT